MKKSLITSVLAVLIASATTVGAQNYPEEYLGLPGDNLNLYAVMDLFRNSETLEDFEKGINDRESRINNLDLNGDNMVDYITVSDYRDGKVHTIVLRAVLGRKEFQDVAVITVEKLRRNKVMIQLIGDEALYGRNYIIEPVYAGRPNPGYYGDPVYSNDVTVINNYYYDMFDWPVAMYIYSPHYSGWHSSWYWGYYPAYWDPWRPDYWDYYYGYHSGWYPHYYANYQHSDYHRYHRYNDFYYHGIREQSPQVQHRIATGNYRQTYSRPDQRSEGAALYSRTHSSRTEARDNTGSGGQGRREAAPQTARGQVPAAGTSRTKVDVDADRRPATGAATGRRTVSEAATDRRTVNEAATDRRATVSSRTETAPASVKKTEAPGRSSAIGDERPAAAGVERRETPSQATVSRTTVDSKVAETRVAEVRANEARANEARAAEARANESRAAEARANESRANEARANESRAAEARANEAREAQSRAAEVRRNDEAQSRAAEMRANEARANEARANESRAADARANENRAAEARASEARAAEARRSEEAQRSTSTTESGTVRPIRK